MREHPDEARLRRILDEVVGRAVALIDPARIWLFGSYARGTARRASDVDLAFEVPSERRYAWPAFVTAVGDEVPALIDLDLIDLGTCDPRLAAEITTTGRVIHARQP